MCLKIIYETKAAARSAANVFTRGKRHFYKVYYCHQCECWHRCSSGKKKMKKNKIHKYKYNINKDVDFGTWNLIKKFR